MINKLGIVFLLALLTSPFVAVDYFWGDKFIWEFLRNQSLQIMGTMLALNIATASFLVGYLIDIEMKAGKSIFDNSMREIKHSIYFMLILFFIQMISLTVIDTAVISLSSKWKYLAVGFSLLLFLAYLFCLYEMTAAIFSIRKLIEK